MNIKIWLPVLLVAAISCNNQQQTPEQQAAEVIEQHAHEKIPVTLQLKENGDKWEADEPTHNNVQTLSKLAADFKSGGDTSLEGYLKAGDTLQAGIGQLVKDCKMKGAAHEALHLWLEPLIEIVKELNESKDVAAASQNFSNADQQIQLYYDYFHYQ